MEVWWIGVFSPRGRLDADASRHPRGVIEWQSMDQIQYADFAKVAIRIGVVKAAEVPEGSEKVIKLTVDFGKEIGDPAVAGGTRTIFAGIKQDYSPEELVGRQLPFVVNLEPKKMGELGYSQAMLMAVVGEDGRPVLLKPDQEVKAGDKVI